MALRVELIPLGIAAIPDGATRCHYCGAVASSVDHVIPRALEKALRLHGERQALRDLRRHHRVRLVDCCRECNSVLNSTYLEGIDARRKLLRERLRRRYAAYIALPDWSGSELAQLSAHYQKRVIAGLLIRDWIQRRLAWRPA